MEAATQTDYAIKQLDNVEQSIVELFIKWESNKCSDKDLNIIFDHLQIADSKKFSDVEKDFVKNYNQLLIRTFLKIVKHSSKGFIKLKWIKEVIKEQKKILNENR